MNIQQPTTSEVDDTYTVMVYNEYLDPPMPQDISNVFAVSDFSSHSSSDPTKYKHVWIKEKVIWSSILSTGECPDVGFRVTSKVIGIRPSENNWKDY